MDDEQFVLDKEAEELFEKLGGIEKREALSIIGDIARAFKDEQARSDPWRILMIELVYEICTCFLDYKFFKGAPKTEDHVAPITAKVRKLSVMPNHDGQVLVRYRGLHSSETNPIGLDYLISFQDLIINLESVPALAKRHQATQAHLHEQLIEALSVFRANNITTLFVQVPSAGQDTADSLGQCIRILSQYYQAVYDGSPIIVTSQGKSFEVPLVHDHENKPDPNLTLLAGLNRLDKANMDALLNKVDHLIRKESIHIPIYDITNAYNAIFSTEQLQDKLIKPPLEVNNVKWLMLASDQEILHKEKMDLVNTVFEKFGGASQEAVQIINTIYEGNFEDFSPYDILGSLGKITTVLEGIETGKKGPGVERELLGNVQDRLDPVRDEVLESLTVKGDLMEAGGPGDEPVSARIHGKIVDLVMFFKGRSKTRKKLIAIMTASVTFDDEDYDIIGRMFRISPKEARHLVEAIEACFDEKGGFLRKSFEDRISELAKYGENIFFFLWFYLKEMSRSTDRVSFLNALQFLLARLDHPEEALSKLLEDFVSTPAQVLPSDRDAIVLGNILVRKENWEIGTEIEITPEEVLRLDDNINPAAVKAAVQAIYYREDDFIRKIETIHSNTMEWLEWAATEEEESFLKYLLSLEREMYIFLSILNPPIARHVLRNAILAYGDPQSQVYSLKRTRENLNALMTLLRVVVRACQRVGNGEDLRFLGQIKEKHNEFVELKDDSHYLDSLNRVIDFSDKAKDAIEKELSKIAQKLPDLSHLGPAYLVGGSLRDRILNRPSIDHDFAVPGNARAYAKKAAEELGSHLVELGTGNKVVFRVVRGNHVFDFSPFQGKTIEDDLRRRDFTINALGFDLVSERLIDPVGGIDDIRSGKIRLISENAFHADPLRMLRAFRLGAVLGFEVDPATGLAVKKLVHLVSRAAPERVRSELFKMMGADRSFAYLRQMSEVGLLFKLIPELEPCCDCPSNDSGGRVFDHALGTYEEMEALLNRFEGLWPVHVEAIRVYLEWNQRKALLKWAALLHDVGKPETRRVDADGKLRFLTHEKKGAVLVKDLCSRLRMSTADQSYSELIVANHLHPLHLFDAHLRNQLTSRGLVRFARKYQDDVIGLVFHSLADQRAKKGHSLEMETAYSAFLARILNRYFDDFKPTMVAPRLVTGKDLIEHFKLAPSKQIGRLLQAVEEARLCGEVQTREEAVELVAKLLEMEGDAGIEPATPSSGGLCSIR